MHFLNSMVQYKYVQSKRRIRDDIGLVPDGLSCLPNRAEVLLQDFVARIQNLLWSPPYCQVGAVPGLSYL